MPTPTHAPEQMKQAVERVLAGELVLGARSVNSVPARTSRPQFVATGSGTRK
jgi:hypothetical protein